MSTAGAAPGGGTRGGVAAWRLRDAFAPGWLFPAAFVACYTAPYLGLVDYSDIMPPPGAYMACLAAAGLLSYLAGLALARRRWSTRALAWPDVATDAWQTPWALPLLIALTAASLALLALTFWLGSMIPLLEANKEAARFAFTARLGYKLNALTRLPVIAAIACGLYVLASRGRWTRANAVAAALVVLSLGAVALLGHRGLPVFILAPLVICAHYLVRAIPMRWLVASGGLLAVALGVASYLRLASSPVQLEHLLAHSTLPAWVPSWLAPSVTLVAFGPLTFNFVLAEVPRREPFQYGMALFNGAFGILPGHQATISELVSRRIFQFPEGAAGLPPTILGGFYFDFGVPGIVIGMLLVGVIGQWLYWRMFSRRTLWSVFFYAYWSFNLFVALYGDFIANDLIWFIPVSIACIDGVLILTWRARRRRSEATAGS